MATFYLGCSQARRPWGRAEYLDPSLYRTEQSAVLLWVALSPLATCFSTILRPALAQHLDQNCQDHIGHTHNHISHWAFLPLSCIQLLSHGSAQPPPQCPQHCL